MSSVLVFLESKGREISRISLEALAAAHKSEQTRLESALQTEKDLRLGALGEREKARAELEEEKRRLVEQLRGEVAGLSLLAAERLVGDVVRARRAHERRQPQQQRFARGLDRRGVVFAIAAGCVHAASRRAASAMFAACRTGARLFAEVRLGNQ